MKELQEKARMANAAAGRRNVEPELSDEPEVEEEGYEADADAEGEVFEEPEPEPEPPRARPTAQRQAAPVRQQAAPARQQAAPVRQQAAPARQQAAPARQQAAPARQTAKAAPPTAIARQAPAVPSRVVARPSASDILALTEQQVDEADPDELEKKILAGLDAFHSFEGNSTTYVRIVPLLDGPPINYLFSHWLDDKGYSVPCANMMTEGGAHCDHCMQGIPLKRSILAIGYRYSQTGEPVYTPKIFRFSGTAIRQIAATYKRDKSVFSLQNGVMWQVDVSGKGKQSKMAASVVNKSESPAFPDDDTLEEFYEAMRAVYENYRKQFTVRYDEQPDDGAFNAGYDA
jgi:hypothetical protein